MKPPKFRQTTADGASRLPTGIAGVGDQRPEIPRAPAGPRWEMKPPKFRQTTAGGASRLPTDAAGVGD